MSNFIKILTFCALVACIHGLSMKEIKEISGYTSECMIKHKINPLTIKRLKDGDLSKNDEKNQCFVNCIMEKIGLLKNGELTVNEEQVKSTNDEKAIAVYDACKDTKGTSDCETAFKLYECYLNNKSSQQ